MRNIGIKNPDFSPEQMHSSQKHQPNDMKNGARTNIDLKFFMEDNIENDEAFYATLDDQDSINSENLTTYPKLSSKNSEVIDTSLNFILNVLTFLSPTARSANVFISTVISLLLGHVKST